MLLLLFACNGPDSPAVGLEDSAAPIDTNTDTDTRSNPTGLALGDPITTLGADFELPSVYEWVDVVLLDENTALLGGVSGYAIFDIDKAEVIKAWWDTRLFSVEVDLDNGLAVLGGRIGSPMVIDISDPRNPGEPVRGSGDLDDGTAYEDIAIDDGLIAVGWQESGVRFFSTALLELGSFPGNDVFAVALVGDRALITDERELILLDISDPTAPTELTRTTLPGEGRDIDISGSRVAVAMGGIGVMVLTLEDDVLTTVGQLTPTGSAQAVSMDGDYLWIASWDVVALAYIGEGGPVMLGHEEPNQSAIGIAAGFGRAVIGDWASATVMELTEGVGGPELVIPREIWFTENGTDQDIRLSNNGLFTLELTFEPASDGFSVEEQALTLEPGESYRLTITPPENPKQPGVLPWSSNDPDEPSGELILNWANLGVGSEHPDFTFQGFDLPDTTLTSTTLSDHRDKAVYLIFWAEY